MWAGRAGTDRGATRFGRGGEAGCGWNVPNKVDSLEMPSFTSLVSLLVYGERGEGRVGCSGVPEQGLH
jgi:hypothetical protein